MGGREAICEREKYQSTNIGGKSKWEGGVDRLSSGGDGLRKERRDYEKKCDTWQLRLRLKVAKD